MTNVSLPPIWLIVLIVGLTLLSETVYTPSLPDIAHALHASESMVEYTLTIYLFGFALGTLFWGKVSDTFGRKYCVLGGLIIFILGCIGCYYSNTIEMLMTSRLMQAFGGSIGSVLGQAICRDAFHGPALGRAYSSVASSIALFPAIGPVIGGVIAEYYDWASIFLFLILFAIFLIVVIIMQLPETHLKENRKPIAIFDVASKLLKDRKVIGFGIIVAGANGIQFSYFAEGSFYLIESLGLSPSQYGISFIAIAFSTMVGGALSRKLQQSCTSQVIMEYGLVIIAISSIIFSCLVIMHTYVLHLPTQLMIAITILGQMGAMFGVCMTTSNALALALVNYKWCIGTASSLFGFFYYCLISLCTLEMGYLHDGTLMPMPLYFLGIGVLMILVNKYMVRE